MIASDDVRRVTFERIMRGYRCEDVDDYLKQVADAMDALSQENMDLQNKVHILGQRIDQYRAEEDTLRTTMINAQRMGENVIKEAKQKAAETIRAANIKADDREQRARDEVDLAQQEIITLKHEANAFKKMLLDKYRAHIEMLSNLPEYEENADIVVQQEPVEEAVPGLVAEYHAYTEPESDPVIEPLVTTPIEETTVEPAVEDTTPVAEPKKDKRVDTVEFAIAPKSDGDGAEVELPVDDLSREQQVSALFASGAGAPATAPKTRGRATSKAKTKTTAKETPADGLPAAFDSFEGVDFDS